jgi:hypothetical protein
MKENTSVVLTEEAVMDPQIITKDKVKVASVRASGKGIFE